MTIQKMTHSCLRHPTRLRARFLLMLMLMFSATMEAASLAKEMPTLPMEDPLKKISTSMCYHTTSLHDDCKSILEEINEIALTPEALKEKPGDGSLWRLPLKTWLKENTFSE